MNEKKTNQIYISYKVRKNTFHFERKNFYYSKKIKTYTRSMYENKMGMKIGIKNLYENVLVSRCERGFKMKK